MKWTKVPPSVPGWYWRRWPTEPFSKFSDIVKVEEPDEEHADEFKGKLLIYGYHSAQGPWDVAEGGEEWAGPIPEPS